MEAHTALMSGTRMVGKTSESHFQTVYGAASAVNCKAVKTLVANHSRYVSRYKSYGKSQLFLCAFICPVQIENKHLP